MTRAEYLEFVEEGLAFPETGVGSPNPASILYDHEEVIQALRAAHTDYCRKVAAILDIDRTYQESGGVEDRPEEFLDPVKWLLVQRQLRDSEHMASNPNFKPADTGH